MVADIEAFWANIKEEGTKSGQTRGKVEGFGLRWVTITNLQSEAGKKLNDHIGKVLTQDVNQDGRHQVQVEGIKMVKLMKPVNLKDVADDDLVRVYRLTSDGEGEIHEVLIFPKSHSLFQNNPELGNCPAMALCGWPLMVQKTKPRKILVERGDYDNVWATWLMINPNNGFAPLKWQSYVGPVYVFRPNGSADVSCDDMDATNEFLSSLLDMYGGDEPDFDPRTWLNPDFFSRFINTLKSNREESNMGSALEGLTLTEENTVDNELAAQAAQIHWQR